MSDDIASENGKDLDTVEWNQAYSDTVEWDQATAPRAERAGYALTLGFLSYEILLHWDEELIWRWTWPELIGLFNRYLDGVASQCNPGALTRLQWRMEQVCKIVLSEDSTPLLTTPPNCIVKLADGLFEDCLWLRQWCRLGLAIGKYRNDLDSIDLESTTIELPGVEHILACVEAVDKVCASGRNDGKAVGMFVSNVEEAKYWKEKGASLFLLGSDQAFLIAGARNLVSALR